MKQFMALALFFMPGGFIARAQMPDIGFKGGVNVYMLHNNNGVNYDNKTGFHAGMLAHIHVNRHFAIQPELVYSEQGAGSVQNGIPNNLQLGYVNIPVLFQYIIEDRFRLEAGPQLGFMVKANQPVDGLIKDRRDLYHTADLSVGMGLGYLNRATGLGIDARCNMGFIDISKDNSMHSYNRVFQLGVFYLFGTVK